MSILTGFKLKESLFLNRFDKVDWKHIASVDIQEMKANMSWDMIEKNVRNILCCHLETEFEGCNVDPNLKKLYQLAQVTIECLLQLQLKASHELELCQEKLIAKKTALDSLCKNKDECEKQIRELKKENKKIAHNSQYYRCPNCPKTFFNGDYLLGHWQRRHPEVMLRSTSINQPPYQMAQPSVPVNIAVSPKPPIELEELKVRLQVAEKQLLQEQQLLYSINEKMKLSDKNLQGILVQEVEKLRRDILELRVDSPASKIVESSSVQTSPRLSRAPSVSTDVEHADSVKSITIEQVANSDNVSLPARPATPPTPAVRTIIQPQPVRLAADEPKTAKEESDDPSISSLLDTEEEEVQIKATKQRSVISNPKVEVDRKVLAERFKNTIKDALAQRLQKLGLDIRKASKVGERKFKQISHELKISRPKTAEFISLRKQLKKEIEACTPDRKKMKHRRHEHKEHKISGPLKIIPSSVKSVGVTKVASPIRAPIPAPRSNLPVNGPNLMARDGEATSVSVRLFTYQQENRDQTFVIKERSPSPVLVKPESPVLVIETPAQKSESDNKATSDQESDSFSFSSLDAILSELKRPSVNYTPSVSNPGTPSVKSVQWRDPVETVAPLDDSWGI